MKIELNRIEEPYVFQLKNETGAVCTFDANAALGGKNKGLTPMNIAIYRDLHCWDMSVNWIPYGAYKSYSVTIKVKSSILQDLKLSKRQGFYNTYQ